MFTYLDLLVVVSLALVAAGVLALALMFLIKNRKVSRVFLYVAAVLGVYIGTVGYRINWLGFELQAGLAVLFALMGVAAVVLERVSKKNPDTFLLARIMASVGLVAGLANALMI